MDRENLIDYSDDFDWSEMPDIIDCEGNCFGCCRDDCECQLSD